MPTVAIPALLKALHFAADKHRDQRRKGSDASPYINHPIEVCELLARVGGVTDLATLQAAILHDTVEDTEATLEEIESEFGKAVRDVVAEVSDDTSLPKEERKRAQIERTPRLSERARLIKIADKTCNIRDVTHAPPAEWTLERRTDYLDWADRVVDGCRGSSEPLESFYDRTRAECRRAINAER